MNVTDTIADALTRLRNALHAKLSVVVLPKSKMVLRLVEILKQEGYVEDFITKRAGIREEIHIALKYDTDGKPVISDLSRTSKPGRRVYCAKDEIPEVMGGLGVAILSTSRGVMTAREARAQGVGGELLCTIY
jgi:small subunit ribosomal protein S8